MLVRRHRDRLWAVALRTTGHREDAADALQEALVSAHRRAASYRGDAAVTTWLHRIVVNACLDRLRAARSRRTDPLPDDLAERRVVADASRPGRTGPAAGDPAAAAQAADERRLVLDALATLPPQQRAALVLVDLEGYAVAEAAAVLDCRPGTVKSRCARGRAALADLLRPLVTAELESGDRPPRADPPPGGNRAALRRVPPPPPRAPPRTPPATR